MDTTSHTQGLTFRFAEREDIPLILQFIRELADYEKMLDQVVADEETLETWIFDKGRAGIYLEDLYVKPQYRGKGYGKSILRQLAAIALERKCGRLEWWCLNWNRPSIDFYLSIGAEPMSDWTVYRIAGETLKKLGSR